jgi:hypothetical protein
LLLISTLWLCSSGGLLLVVGHLENHLRHGLVGGILADIHHMHGLVSGVLADQLHGHRLILVVDRYGYNLAGGVLADSLPGYGWPSWKPSWAWQFCMSVWWWWCPR